jgi:hypothetical protein
MLVVLVIIGIIGAIAIPSALNQRTQAIEAGMEADLLATSASVDVLLSTWRGVPPAQTNIATTGSTWTATPAGQSEVATGEVNNQSNLSGTIFEDGSYCLSITNDGTSSTIIFRSDNREAVPGTCPTTPIGGVGTLPDTVTLDLPAMPGGLTVTSPEDNRVEVSWNAVTGATSYTVSVAGVSTQETDSSTTTATFTGISPGTYTVVVYAQNTNGAGPGAYESVAVAGTIAYALSSRLGAYTYTVADQVEKNQIAGQTAGSTVWVADTAWVETWNGSAWVITDGTLPKGSISRDVDLIIPDSTDTALIGTEQVHGMTYSAGEFTIGQAGQYLISFSATFDNVNNIGNRIATVKQNGNAIIRSVATPSTDFPVGLNGTRVVQLNVNDVIKLDLQQGSGNDLNIQADANVPAFLDITYLGPSL